MTAALQERGVAMGMGPFLYFVYTRLASICYQSNLGYLQAPPEVQIVTGHAIHDYQSNLDNLGNLTGRRHCSEFPEPPNIMYAQCYVARFQQARPCTPAQVPARVIINLI